MSLSLGKGKSVHHSVGTPCIKVYESLVCLGDQAHAHREVIWVGRATSGRMLTQTMKFGLYL